MDVCVLAEDPKLDQRVPLSPGAVKGLVRSGERVFVQQGAGDYCQYHDADYEEAGATVVYSREETLARGDVVVMLQAPSLAELSRHLTPTYIQTLPTRDGWNRPLAYQASGDDYTISSLGKDGR